MPRLDSAPPPPDAGLRRVAARCWEKRLEVTLTAAAARGGERVSGVVALSWPDASPVRGVRLEMDGAEDTEIRVHAGHVVVTHKEHSGILEERRILFGGPAEGLARNVGSGLKAIVGRSGFPLLDGGDYRHAFDFVLPAGALPTHEGRHARIRYEVRAWVDVPGARDLRAVASLRVLGVPPLPGSATAIVASGEARFASAGSRLAPGGEVVGTLELPPLDGARGELELELRAVERSRAKKQRRETAAGKERASLLGGPPRAALRLAVPEDFPPPYVGLFSSVQWELRVKVPVGTLRSRRYAFPLTPGA